MISIVLFAKLLIAHALCDYPLQGDFLAKAKNPNTAIAGIPWWIAMFMHAAIHGGAVWLLTGRMSLGLLELGLHFSIDCAKNDGATTFAQDQALHVACKVVEAML